MAKKRRKDKPSLFGRILGGIERAGNRLPHPITLFALFTLGIILVSALCALLGVSATGELINSKTLELETQTVTAVSLLSKEGVVYMLTSMVSNFTSFAPLGVVLVTMLGIGCAEGSGYLSALLKKMVSVTPRAIITPVVVLLGVMSNIATDIGYVVLIPVGALVFMAYGRHPLAGLAAAFAGVSGGFSANLLIGALDPLLAGISTEAAHIVDSGYTVLATDNWFFMIASTVLIVAIGTLVTDKIVEPRLGRFEQEEGQADHRLTALTGQEAKGMKIASLVLLLLVAGLIAAAIPRASLLRNPQTGSLTTGAPLIDGIIILLALLFFVPSVLYGRISGTYKNEKDVAGQLEKHGGHGRLHRPDFRRRPVHQLFQLQQAGYDSSHQRGGISQVLGHQRAAADGDLRAVHLSAQPADGLRHGKMDGAGPHFHPHVHDAGLFAGADPGGLPHR